jgi:hypothetical protein
MDESKKQTKREGNHKSDEAPNYMQPQKPVLDEPLMEVEIDAASSKVEGTAELDAAAGDAVREEEGREVEEAVLSESKAEDGDKLEAKEPPYSPYFPRGVYEDAGAVEAYYGRGEVKEGE